MLKFQSIRENNVPRKRRHDMTGSIVSFLLFFTFTENQLKTRDKKEIKLFLPLSTNVIIISVYQFILSVSSWNFIKHSKSDLSFDSFVFVPVETSSFLNAPVSSTGSIQFFFILSGSYYECFENLA